MTIFDLKDEPATEIPPAPAAVPDTPAVPVAPVAAAGQEEGLWQAPCGCVGREIARGKSVVYLKIGKPCKQVVYPSLNPGKERRADAILHVPPGKLKKPGEQKSPAAERS